MNHRKTILFALVLTAMTLCAITAFAEPGLLAAVDNAPVPLFSGDDLDQLIAFFKARKWGAAGSGIIIVLTRLVKSDNKFWLTIPAKRRIFLVWGLAVAGAFFERWQLNASVQAVATDFLLAIVISVVVYHETYIAAIREGKELPLPFPSKTMIIGARPNPSAPVTTTAADVAPEPVIITPPTDPPASPPA